MTDTTRYAIDKDVPLPDQKGKGPWAKYPFRQMEIGDSVFIPDAYGSTVRSAAHAAGRRLGRKFCVRSKFGEPGARVWRVG